MLNWHALSSRELEETVARLLEERGVPVRLVGGAGDCGVDIWLRDEIIVQCKSHQARSTPGHVRELFGTLVLTRAKAAILVNPHGFTDGARQLAWANDIAMWDLETLRALEPEDWRHVPSDGIDRLYLDHQFSKLDRLFSKLPARFQHHLEPPTTGVDPATPHRYARIEVDGPPFAPGPMGRVQRMVWKERRRRELEKLIDATAPDEQLLCPCCGRYHRRHQYRHLCIAEAAKEAPITQVTAKVAGLE